MHEEATTHEGLTARYRSANALERIADAAETIVALMEDRECEDEDDDREPGRPPEPGIDPDAILVVTRILKRSGLI